jgi:hypothetical protein
MLEADPTRRCPPFIRAGGSASPLMQATACNDADLPNLRLAAAAPNLLAALKDTELRATQAILASGIGQRKDRTAFLLGELDRIKAAARAAIAKAEGKL